MFHPKGAAIINAMEDYSREMHRKNHYSFVQTPHITKGGLYETSGHLQWYKDGMYPPMHLDEEKDENGNIVKQGSRLLPQADELPDAQPHLQVTPAFLPRTAVAPLRVRHRTTATRSPGRWCTD